MYFQRAFESKENKQSFKKEYFCTYVYPRKSVIMLLQIGLMTFDEQVNFATLHPCYPEDLALMTPTNKDVLTKFASQASASTGKGANFSNALSEAFRLLNDTGDDTEPGGKTRGL